MLLVHKREGQVAESCIIVCHPLQKTCNKQSHTLASTQGMRWCWKVWDKFNSLSSTKRLGISENSSIVPRSQAPVNRIGQFFLRFWLFGSFCFWLAATALSTLDCLAEIREVDVVHALSSRQPRKYRMQTWFQKMENFGENCMKFHLPPGFGENFWGERGWKFSPASWIANEKSAQQIAASAR